METTLAVRSNRFFSAIEKFLKNEVTVDMEVKIKISTLALISFFIEEVRRTGSVR